jgi:hypothetical protein
VRHAGGRDGVSECTFTIACNGRKEETQNATIKFNSALRPVPFVLMAIITLPENANL